MPSHFGTSKSSDTSECRRISTPHSPCRQAPARPDSSSDPSTHCRVGPAVRACTRFAALPSAKQRGAVSACLYAATLVHPTVRRLPECGGKTGNHGLGWVDFRQRWEVAAVGEDLQRLRVESIGTRIKTHNGILPGR